ncbi:MAG TPA: ABC transporter substrate-binding protein [Chloroflexota bacterium]|nr:ABC transporter substrate-binding protein [Chloroflexota bacterium]
MPDRCRPGARLLALALAGLLAACGAQAAGPSPPESASRPGSAPGPAAGSASVAVAAPSASASQPAAQTTAPAPRSLDKVTFTLPSQGMDFVFAAVGSQRGLFRDEGLDVSLEQAVATVGIPAVVSGQYDFTGSVGSAQSAILQGAPLKVVMVAQDRPAYGFFARPGINSIPELKGKSLGITTAGSAAQIMANLVLEKYGVDPVNDITWVQLRTPANLWAALSTGVVDASMVGTADLVRPVKEGYVDLKIYKDPSVHNASVGLTTSEQRLRDKPDMIKRMIRGSIKAVQYMKADKAGTVPIMADFLDMSPEEAGELYDLTIDAFIPQGYADDETLRQSLDVLVTAGEVKETPPLSQVFDLHLAREAYAELQREGWKP